MRLRELGDAYGDRVGIHWRAFPLIPDQRPGRLVTDKTREGRRRVAAEEPRALFAEPTIGITLPTSSVPALTAAKCAERQGDAEFRRLHDRLFVGHFRDNLDISRPDVLRRLARESDIDVARFERDYADGTAYDAVLHDYAEAVAWFGVSAVPTVVFGEKVSVVGAVPAEHYRIIVDWFLAGQPGGLVPLAATASGATRPGGA